MIGIAIQGIWHEKKLEVVIPNLVDCPATIGAIIGCPSGRVRSLLRTGSAPPRLLFESYSGVVRLEVEAEPKRSRSPPEGDPNMSRSSPEAEPNESRSAVESQPNINKALLIIQYITQRLRKIFYKPRLARGTIAERGAERLPLRIN